MTHFFTIVLYSILDITNLFRVEGAFLLAHECDIKDGFRCTGGLSDDSDEEYFCDDLPSDCNNILRCKVKAVGCAISSIPGLTFPFLMNPSLCDTRIE